MSGKSDGGVRNRNIRGVVQRKFGGLAVESKSTNYPTFAEFNASVDGDTAGSQDPTKMQVNSAKLAGEKNKLGSRVSKRTVDLRDDSNIKPFEKRDRLQRAKSPNLIMDEPEDVVVVKKQKVDVDRKKSLKSNKKLAISKS